MCFRCEIEKNALHYKDLIILYQNSFTPTSVILLYIQECKGCAVAWCVRVSYQPVQIQAFIELHTCLPYVCVCVCVHDVLNWDSCTMM